MYPASAVTAELKVVSVPAKARFAESRTEAEHPKVIARAIHKNRLKECRLFWRILNSIKGRIWRECQNTKKAEFARNDNKKFKKILWFLGIANDEENSQREIPTNTLNIASLNKKCTKLGYN